MKVKIATGPVGLITVAFDPIDNETFTDLIAKYDWANMSYEIGTQSIEDVTLRDPDEAIMFMIEASEYSPYIKK